jgi:cell division protein ZapA
MDSGSSEKKPVRVTIFNQSYTLRASGDPRETEDLAKFVDSLMDSIASRTGDSEASRVAVLACLHLADRLRALEGQLTELKQRVEAKSEQFSLLLEQALEAPERKA